MKDKQSSNPVADLKSDPLPPAGKNGEPARPPKRAHKATYSTDKRHGGYLVRVEGPHAAKFAGRAVPVTRKSGEENTEQLDRLLWSGTDEESGKPVALYSFKQEKRKPEDVEF